MNFPVIDTIKEALENAGEFSPEKLQALVQETVATFQSIQSKVSSDNENEREEGRQVALELKIAMEEQILSLQQKLNMNSDELNKYLEDPANFSQEELKSMDESKRNLEELRIQIQSKS